jgi:hypothetical protein
MLRPPHRGLSVGGVSVAAIGNLRRSAATLLLAGGVFACALVSASAATTARPLIEPTGIGSVHFGIAKAQAVSELSRLLGKPSARFVNSGCGPRYTETAWRHLYVEFRLGRFNGYRYIENGWPADRFGKKPAVSTRPLIATSKGITLGSTLGQVRAAYGRLDLVGTDRWQASNGLIFYDNAERQPPPASSRIIEIKIGTCGDY